MRCGMIFDVLRALVKNRFKTGSKLWRTVRMIRHPVCQRLPPVSLITHHRKRDGHVQIEQEPEKGNPEVQQSAALLTPYASVSEDGLFDRSADSCGALIISGSMVSCGFS